MPPKTAKAVGRTKDNPEENPLQAVVIADTFETKFTPLSYERPRCLIPLAGTPLIDYTLEYLASVGVQEVIFYAGAHVDQVETYLSASKWLANSSPFRNVTTQRCMAASVGDIMRDLDQKGLMDGDFLCVSGDIVSDFPIIKALKAHKDRREKDKNAIMTMLLRERKESEHRYRHQTIQTFVIDPTKDRCLHYEETQAGDPFGTHIDAEVLKSAEIDIRQDLVDCRIDICTPDVLSLWSDNFDNQKPRKDFLFGILKDYELNGKTVHTYIVDGYYANRVDDPAAYAAITYDLQHGVTGSLALANNVAGTKFKRIRKDVLQEDDVIVQRPCRVGHGTVVGAGTSIGAGCVLLKSVIGQRCQIGKRASIKSAFLWDDVMIGSNVQIDRAIIGSEAYVGNNCVIEEGALISVGAKVPSGTHVPAGKRIYKTSSNQTDTKRSTRPEEVYSDDEDEDVAQEPNWARSLYQRADFNESASSIASDVSEISDDISKDGSRSQSFATHTSEDEPTDRFQHDTAAILVARMQEGRNVDDMQSELMGLRFSGGADGTQVQKAVATALTKHINNEVNAGTNVEQATRKTLEQYRYLIKRQNAEQTIDEQIEFLVEAQADLSRRSNGARIMPFFVKDLYDLDVFEEEAFTEWFNDERSQESSIVEIRGAAKPFIDWLATADEESDEEDEEEDEDED